MTLSNLKNIFISFWKKEKLLFIFFIYFHIKIVWRLHFGKFKKKFQKREAGKKVSSIPLRSFQQENRQTSRHNTARKKKRLSHAWLLPMPTLYNDRSKSLYTATFLFSALDLIESSSFAVRKKREAYCVALLFVSFYLFSRSGDTGNVNPPFSHIRMPKLFCLFLRNIKTWLLLGCYGPCNKTRALRLSVEGCTNSVDKNWANVIQVPSFLNLFHLMFLYCL